MEKSKLTLSESHAKGNSEDSLLVVYILQILKKYSSLNNQLSSQEVMAYLEKDYSIGNPGKADAERKKVRRILDTLYAYYDGGCIKKLLGKTKNGHKWYYDQSRDKFADIKAVIQDPLTETEAEILVDLISAASIFNSEGTRGLIDKILRKTSATKEDREGRLEQIEKEEWQKSPNLDLAEKKELIEECFDGYSLTFDYEDEESVVASPVDLSFDDGICYLYAKVGEEYRKFSLDKIRIRDSFADGFKKPDGFGRYSIESDSDKTALDSLFVNIPTIKSAIKDKKCIHFSYRTYAVSGNRVSSKDEEKSVLPHSLVFNDGKYYLIGIDENSPELNKIGYFRVDLMYELYLAELKSKLSDWDRHLYEITERARLVERHPLMLAGKEVSITFKVIESALDRVAEDFAVKADEFHVTDETRPVQNPFDGDFHDERVVSVKVRTTKEEAFRWALANADAVELAEPQEIRDRLGRIAEPVHKIYATTLADRVRENIDRICKTGMFKITAKVDEKTAAETYKELKRQNKTDLVTGIHIGKIEGDAADYLGDFAKARYLNIGFAPNCKKLAFASKLTEISSIDIFKTQISDASFLATMEDLRYVEISETPIRDLSFLSGHKHILSLSVSDTLITDIGFIEGYEHLGKLDISGCPIADYTPLLRIRPLDFLKIDEKAVAALGMEALVRHHPNAVIKVQQKIDNRKV